MESYIFLGWILFTILNAFIAKQKGRNVTNALLVSIFLSPITSYLYLLAVPDINELPNDKKEASN